MSTMLRMLSARNSSMFSSALKMRSLSGETLSKETRKAIRSKKLTSGKSTGGSVPMSKGWIPFYGCAIGIGAFTWAITAENDLGESLRNSDAWKWVLAQYREVSKPFSEPNAKKLLPDWPYFPNTPPGVPCPPTLVIDLEGTLCTSVWDHKFGWRHVKRPGVEKFLRDMARAYELVIFTSNIAGTAEPIILALDKDNVVIHRLYREATKFVDGAHVKDLSALNRDLRKVIIIDDDPKAFQLQPSNAIHVPTYKDPMDKSDTTLEDLTPFLLALVNENVPDFRATISSFPANDAKTVAGVYNSKLNSVKSSKEMAMNRGLGGILRSIPANPTQAPSDAFVVERAAGDKVSRVQKRAAESSGPKGPLGAENKGGLWKRIDSLKSEAEEVNRKKAEAFHEAMLKREQQKAQAAAEDN